MKLFWNIYKKVIELSKHRHAEYYLGGLSFAESSFFPIPPDVMLMPMSLARPERWVRYALLTTIASVLGGVAGYFLGIWAHEWLESTTTTGGMQISLNRQRTYSRLGEFGPYWPQASHRYLINYSQLLLVCFLWPLYLS